MFKIFYNKIVVAVLFFPMVIAISLLVVNISYIKAFVTNPDRVGSLIPSSSYLASLMIEPIHWVKKPTRFILEVGAGNGSITEHIVKGLRQDDYLDIVEIDPVFCQELKSKYNAPNIRVACGDIIELSFDRKYDVIVSSLPFNSLPASDVYQVFIKYENILLKEGYMSYFEYKWLPQFYLYFLEGAEKDNLLKVWETVETFNHKYKIQYNDTYLNFTPARVNYLKY